ncbi:MAG: NPCBM/NEW2 domain-containing protein [Kiritimatiellae bacterium]|nr:NPCBM/NEW2 domain-containing protein [Kiritimatiellia bacterium]
MNPSIRVRTCVVICALALSGHGGAIEANAERGPVADDFSFACAAQGYGELNRDVSVDGHPLRIGGVTYPDGLGSHAVSEIPIRVPEGAVRFAGMAGVDDEVGAGHGSVRFRILSGNAVLWESPVMKSGDAAVPFEVYAPHAFHRMLYLQADPVEDDGYDHADWVSLRWIDGPGPKLSAARIWDGSSFGFQPDDPSDQTPALQRALRALREAPGSTLRLAKGTYHFHSSGALRKHFHVSNHEQPMWHPVSLPLVDLRNVTIDGQGSLFLFHGIVQPVLIQDSENVILKNIAFDYATPPHSQGVITQVDAESYVVEVDSAQFPHEIRNGWFVFKGEGWERPDAGTGIVFRGSTGEIVAGTGDFTYKGPLTVLAPGKYRVQRNVAAAGIRTGDVITFRHDLWTSRPHPAFALYRARNVRLDQCPIHASHGMGLLAQRSENIHIRGGGSHPRAGTGRRFSTNADATHFSNCRGTVIAEGGRYEGMMDDAINVHATCLRIEEVIDPQTIRCRYVHPQAVGFETFLPGESLRFIHARTLTPRETRTVATVRKTGIRDVILRLDQPAPEGIGPGDAVENADWFPEVVFRRNVVRNNRARGALFTTPRPVRVEENLFERVAGSAILLAGDANGWYESGGCSDVLIRGNRFRDNLTSRFQFTEALISIYPEVPDLGKQSAYYHGNIRVERNIFETFDVPLLFAISAKGISFRGNQITYNQNYPGWNRPPFEFRRCAGVEISGNRVLRNGQPVPWTESNVKLQDTPSEEIRIR